MWNIIIIRITSASLIRLGLFRCLFPSETAFFDSIFENSLQKSSITQKISVILHSLSTCIVLRFLVVLCLSFNYKSTQTSAPVQVFLVLCCCISAYFLYRTHVKDGSLERSPLPTLYHIYGRNVHQFHFLPCI